MKSIPKQMNDATKTWCFECRKPAGIKVKCHKCPRYYHLTCLKTDTERRKRINDWISRTSRSCTLLKPFDPSELEEDQPPSNSQCYACNLKEKGKTRRKPAMSAEEINYLLGFIFDRVVGWVSSSDLNVRKIKKKIEKKEYLILEDFLVDILDLALEVAINHGGKQLNVDVAKLKLYCFSLPFSRQRPTRMRPIHVRRSCL